MDVALATCRRLPEPDLDDELIRAALARRGIEAGNVAWEDEVFDWSTVKACVIRSTWNYVHHYPEFLQWVDRVSGATRLLNPGPVVHWNGHKGYLQELASKGVPVTPTRLLPRGTRASIQEVAGDWACVVVKPAVSAGSFLTMRAKRDDFAAAQAHVDQHLPDRDLLVQEYLTSIEEWGERSLTWIDGEFTHAIRKNPRWAGGHESVSGEPATMAPDEIAIAMRVVAAAPGPLLYARVDLARDADGGPVLMELELVEPSLFTDKFPPAADRLAAAIERRL